MKAKYLLTSCVIVTAFAFLFWCADYGVSGKQSSAVIQNHFFPPLQRLSALATDLKFSFRGQVAPKNNIVIVDIDEASLEQVGRWPWRRDYIAFLIHRIFEKGANHVVLDLLFPEPQEAVPEELKTILDRKKLSKLLENFQFDKILAGTFKQFQNRLTLGWLSESPCRPRYQSSEECPIENEDAMATIPSTFSQFSSHPIPKLIEKEKLSLLASPTVTTNIPELQASSRFVGFVNGFRDADGAIRKTSLFFLVGNSLYPSLALSAAQMIRKDTLLPQWNAAGLFSKMVWVKSQGVVSSYPNGMVPIHFRGPAYTFPYVSAVDILKEERGVASVSPLKGSIAIVGISALALADLVATPFGREVPGVEVQATVLDNFLSNDFVGASPNSFWIIILAMTVGGLAFSWLLSKVNSYLLVLSFLLVVLPIFYFDFFVLFIKHSQDWNFAFFYIEYFLIALAFLILKYLDGEDDKVFLRAAFSKYVSPKIVEAIIQDPKSLSLGGKREHLTVLFCDIRSFTAYSETMEAKRLGEFLVDFHSRMTDIVFEHQGTLDKYIGDALMCFWGAPVWQPQHGLLATRAALAMAKAIEQHRAYYQKEFGIPLRIGIGLNAGLMNVGNMGSRNAFGYTVVGDEVNLASRLEGLTKVFRTQILTTRNLIELIDNEKDSSILYRLLGEVQVKGKAQAVSLYALEIEEGVRELLPIFEAGLRYFQTGEIEEAKAKFNEMNERCKEKLKREDGPSLAYLERIESERNFHLKNKTWLFE